MWRAKNTQNGKTAPRGSKRGRAVAREGERAKDKTKMGNGTGARSDVMDPARTTQIDQALRFHLRLGARVREALETAVHGTVRRDPNMRTIQMDV